MKTHINPALIGMLIVGILYAITNLIWFAIFGLALFTATKCFKIIS